MARDLLGKLLVRKIGRKLLSGVIIETEAYCANDPACHAARGKTARNAVMFGPPGRAYVYFVYGNHYCLNAVTESHGIPGAVLIRALEPVAGIELMRQNRGGAPDKNLTNGPGKLCQALNIGRAENGCDLTSDDVTRGGRKKRRQARGHPRWGSLMITNFPFGKFKIDRSPRIGISQAQERLWRFFVA
ncbi:MAG: DNA-3-methyladenine glycosylase [Candidatus Margulisiibacteriota bacterium]